MLETSLCEIFGVLVSEKKEEEEVGASKERDGEGDGEGDVEGEVEVEVGRER